MSRKPLAVLAVAMAVIGCGQGTPSIGPSASVVEAGASPAACPDIDLRSPSGDHLDLTGTWHGNDDAYWLFFQVGDCVWATATDRYIADNYTVDVLRGVLLSDFTIPVEFAYAGIYEGYGHATLQIEFGDSDGAETLTLRKVGGCTASGEPPCPPGEISLQTTVWTRASTSVIVPAPTPGP